MAAEQQHLRNPELAFNLAGSFGAVAEDCLRVGFSKDHRNGYQIIPGVVCMAFACELLLKILRDRCGKAPTREHNLQFLYNDLDEYMRATIAFGFQQLAERDLLLELENFARAFVEWRYVFERETAKIDPQSLLYFHHVLHLLVSAKRDGA